MNKWLSGQISTGNQKMRMVPISSQGAQFPTKDKARYNYVNQDKWPSRLNFRQSDSGPV